MSHSSSTLSVNWHEPDKINGQLDHYTVYWYNGMKIISNETIDKRKRSYTIKGLEACVRYNVRVTASTGAGESKGIEETNTTQPIGK